MFVVAVCFRECDITGVLGEESENNRTMILELSSPLVLTLLQS